MPQLTYNPDGVTRSTTKFAAGADWQSQWIDCRAYRFVEFEVTWAVLASLAGTLNVLGRTSLDDPLTIVDPVPIPDGFYGAWPTVNAAGDRATVVIVNPMAWMAVKFTSSGGAATPDVFTLYSKLYHSK